MESVLMRCALLLVLFVSSKADVKEFLTWDDLPSLDSSPADVRGAFSRMYGENPDGIALNHQTYYDAVKPPITEQNSKYCYKYLGEVKFDASQDTGETKMTVAHSSLTNLGDQNATLQAQVAGSWTETVSMTLSTTSTLTFSESVTVEGSFSMGMKFSLSVTESKTTSKSTTQSYSDTVTYKVPPKSIVKIKAVATMKEQTMDFHAPITVDGSFGANFPDRVKGHYFWFAPASDILPKTSGTWKGQLKGVKAVDVDIVASPPTPIKFAT